jgi:hypothetical protein
MRRTSMRRTVISYKVRPETAAVNEELLRDMLDERTITAA